MEPEKQTEAVPAMKRFDLQTLLENFEKDDCRPDGEDAYLVKTYPKVEIVCPF